MIPDGYIASGVPHRMEHGMYRPLNKDTGKRWWCDACQAEAGWWGIAMIAERHIKTKKHQASIMLYRLAK